MGMNEIRVKLKGSLYKFHYFNISAIFISIFLKLYISRKNGGLGFDLILSSSTLSIWVSVCMLILCIIYSIFVKSRINRVTFSYYFLVSLFFLNQWTQYGCISERIRKIWNVRNLLLLGFWFQRVVAKIVVKFTFLALKMTSYYDIDDILAEEEVISSSWFYFLGWKCF